MGPAGSSLVVNRKGPWVQSLTRNPWGVRVRRAVQQTELRLTNLEHSQPGPRRNSPSGSGKGVGVSAPAVTPLLPDAQPGTQPTVDDQQPCVECSPINSEACNWPLLLHGRGVNVATRTARSCKVIGPEE